MLCVRPFVSFVIQQNLLSNVLALLRASFFREWRIKSGWHDRETKIIEPSRVLAMYWSSLIVMCS